MLFANSSKVYISVKWWPSESQISSESADNPVVAVENKSEMVVFKTWFLSFVVEVFFSEP